MNIDRNELDNYITGHYGEDQELGDDEAEERTMEIVIAFTEYATDAVVTIQRKGETFQATVNRILETLLATAESFDDFYGEPEDGNGPSGTY